MKSSSLRESVPRVAATVVAISCHLGLLMLLLRPATYHRDTTLVVETDALALELRLIRPPQPTLTQSALPTRWPIALLPIAHLKLSGSAAEPLQSQRATHVAPLPTAANLTSKPIAPTAPTIPDQYASKEASASDGGFQERLLNAKHSNDVHGVPGSDTHLATGIQLINPMSQGVGSVMRSTQRLFGIPNSHCIDVDVWRHLSPDELSSRHISSSDVDKLDERYSCSKPMGLSF